MGELSRRCSFTLILLSCSSPSCPCFSYRCSGNRPGRGGLAPKSWGYRAGTEGSDVLSNMLIGIMGFGL